MKYFIKWNTLRVCPVLAALCLGLGAGCGVIPTYVPPGYEQPAAVGNSAPPVAPAPLPSAAGAVVGAPPSAQGQPASPEGIDFVRVGDKLVITMLDTPTQILPFEETVRSDGMITLPFNKRILAAGKSKGQLADEIRALYVPGYYKQMTVTIRSEDRFFTVGGEVRTPSRQIYVGTMTVLKAITAVGGFTEFANKHKVEIIRSHGGKDIVDAVKAQEDPRYDLPIFPGDQIHVRRRIF